eukprot:SAG31_NODE_11401_length_1032_cov_1.012821_1_plen_205_part_10
MQLRTTFSSSHGSSVGDVCWISEQVRSCFLVLCPLLEKCGTFIARCDALIEKVSPCVGCGISALAAARAGASFVTANDIDEWALVATHLNVQKALQAHCNAQRRSYFHIGQFGFSIANYLDGTAFAPEESESKSKLPTMVPVRSEPFVRGGQVILIGDMCYDNEMASALRRWLTNLLSPPRCTQRKFPTPLVLVGDPGRHGFKST